MMKYIALILIITLPYNSWCQKKEIEIGTSLSFGKYSFHRKGAISPGINLSLGAIGKNKGGIIFNTGLFIFQNLKGKEDNAYFIPFKAGYYYPITKKGIYLFSDIGTGIMIYTDKKKIPFGFSSGIGWKIYFSNRFINLRSYFTYVNAGAIPEYRWITTQVTLGSHK